MITVAIKGGDEVLGRLNSVLPTVNDSLKTATAQLAEMLVASIRDDFLSGQALNARSGKLVNAISAEAFGDGDAMGARISLDLSEADYGAFWETGFERMVGAGARHGPRKLLGRARERYMLKHPAGVKQFDARPFLHPALDDMREEIISSLSDAGTDAIIGAMQ